MKKNTGALLFLLAALLLAGCAFQTASPSRARDVAPGAETLEGAEATAPEKKSGTLRALIVDGAETGRLLLAGEGDAAGVYLLDAAGVSVTLDGAAADASALEDGMTVEIAYHGALGVTMPAELDGADAIAAYSLGTAQNPGGTRYDLCGLYLQVLDDLWDRDEGLNGGAKYVSVDLSAEPGGLGDAARFAVAWAFAQKHGAEALTLTYNELIEQGYLTAAPEAPDSWREWRDGVLLRISADEQATDEGHSLPALIFSAEKWRSPLGAYFFDRCTAVWPEFGTWTGYSIGGEAIA